MADFVDDPSFYADRRAYFKAQCAHTTYLLEKAREREIAQLNTFDALDLKLFTHRCNGLNIAPLDPSLDTRERSALHAAAEDQQDTVQAYFDSLRAKQAREWVDQEYVPSKPLLAPLHADEVHWLANKLRPYDAKCLANNDCSECMVWEGMINNKKPMLERRRTKQERKNKRKRVIGSAAEVLYNFWREPLRPRQRLKRTCDNPKCVNPYHYK